MTSDSSNARPDIIYTKVDEAPELASGSLLPIVRAFTEPANIIIGTKDISLGSRILAHFPKYLTEDQIQPDDLNELSDIVKRPDANVIKLPNISASVPQLNAAINELQKQGYEIPDYVEHPQNQQQEEIKSTYRNVLGSAVNPVLREGNSDRRAPKAVKEYAKKNPHSMGTWISESKTHVATMDGNDFFANERSKTISKNSIGAARIEFVGVNGDRTILKADISLGEGDVIDATMMSKKALRDFLEVQIKDAKDQDVLFSVHLKATMMKVSDPIIFGHVVSVFFKEIVDKHGKTLKETGIDLNNGMGQLSEKLELLPSDKKKEIAEDIEDCIKEQPALYMVNSDKGVTNLDVPSDVIIDASLPALIRAGGKAWGPDGQLADTKCVIPDSSYAAIYDETIKFCKEHGAFDPAEMGSVPNVGLMAQKAEEYGSHPQTFEAPDQGSIEIVDAAGEILLINKVEEGDIWRMCITRDQAIRNWVKLAVQRANATNTPTIFWLDIDRSHDAELIKKVRRYISSHNTDGLDIKTMSPRDATRFTLERIKRGADTISVTGNVLRDYLTDLFPILEVGTSAKMLSIVPLMNGGGLFETGAGGSAPKHVKQMIEEGHLRWDSLGEFCALVASLEHHSERTGNEAATVLAFTLDRAIGRLLEEKKSPRREVGDIDNRGSHFYLAKYWAEELKTQDKDEKLKQHFAPISEKLDENESIIMSELSAAQGRKVNIGGYYHPPTERIISAMRPSSTFNAIIG